MKFGFFSFFVKLVQKRVSQKFQKGWKTKAINFDKNSQGSLHFSLPLSHSLVLQITIMYNINRIISRMRTEKKDGGEYRCRRRYYKTQKNNASNYHNKV